jgi:phospholipid-translocating ATPase
LVIVFHGEEDGLIRLTVFGQDRYYRRLQVLEFDSNRKRMSTIVLFPDDTIWLVCKGAESTIVPNCIGGPINQTLEHINDYALVSISNLQSTILNFKRIYSFSWGCGPWRYRQGDLLPTSMGTWWKN